VVFKHGDELIIMTITCHGGVPAASNQRQTADSAVAASMRPTSSAGRPRPL
jgi:hypothetical protein